MSHDSKQKVEEKLKELQLLDFDILSNLPSVDSNKVETNVKCTITTYIERISEFECKVIVQSYTYFILGMANVFARGFVKSRTGSIRWLTDEELYEYF